MMFSRGLSSPHSLYQKWRAMPCHVWYIWVDYHIRSNRPTNDGLSLAIHPTHDDRIGRVLYVSESLAQLDTTWYEASHQLPVLSPASHPRQFERDGTSFEFEYQKSLGGGCDLQNVLPLLSMSRLKLWSNPWPITVKRHTIQWQTLVLHCGPVGNNTSITWVELLMSMARCVTLKNIYVISMIPHTFAPHSLEPRTSVWWRDDWDTRPLYSFIIR